MSTNTLARIGLFVGGAALALSCFAANTSSSALDAAQTGDFWGAETILSANQIYGNDAAAAFTQGMIQQYNDCKDSGRSLPSALYFYNLSAKLLTYAPSTDPRVSGPTIAAQIKLVEEELRQRAPKPIADAVIAQSRRGGGVGTIACTNDATRAAYSAAYRAFDEKVKADAAAERARQQQIHASDSVYDDRCLAVFDDSFQFAVRWELRDVGFGIKTDMPKPVTKSLRHCLRLEISGPTVDGVANKVKDCVVQALAVAVVAGAVTEYASAGTTGGSAGFSAAVASLQVSIPACLSLQSVAQDVIDNLQITVRNESHWTDWS